MRDDKNRIMIINRKQIFYKNESNNIINNPSTLEMIRELNKDMMTVSDPKYIISQCIPECIREYFFFDGERLDDYFKKEGSESIKKAVFKLSQIELLDKVIEHLDSKSNDFLKENKNLSPIAEQIKSEIGAITSAKEICKNELMDKTNFLKEAKLNRDEILKKIKNNPVKNSKGLNNDRIEIENKINEYEDKIKNIEIEIEEYFIDISPKILVLSAIKNMKYQIEDKRKKKEIPPGITDEFIKQILHSKKCICGRNISKEDNSEKNICELLNIYNKLSGIGNELLNNQSNIEIILKECDEFESKYLNFEKNKNIFEKEREEHSKRLKKIKEQLALTDESYARYEEKLGEFQNAIEDITVEITKLNSKIENSEIALKNRRENLVEELKKEAKYNLLRNKLQFCEDTLKESKKIKEEIMEETKKSVETETRTLFFDLIWNPESFEDIKIDDNYGLSVIHKSGLESIGSLSSGQRQVLALSFIAALNTVSGFNLPIIIDTPLGRISKDTRLNIASNLPRFLKNKQVILLVTDEEYTSDVRKKLEKSIGKEYEINLKQIDKTGGIATITAK